MNLKYLLIDNVKYHTYLTDKFVKKKFFEKQDPKKILSFIPGSIKKINVKVGDRVSKGCLLVVLDAMKMNNYILSPIDGVIKNIYIKAGDNVTKYQLLIEFE